MWNLFYSGRGSSTEISSVILQCFIRWPLSFLPCLHLWSRCTCMHASAHVFKFFCAFVNTCLWICKCGCICACAVYMYLMQYKPNLFVFSLVWTCQQRLICHYFKSFKTVEHFSLWLTSTLTAQQEAPGPLWQNTSGKLIHRDQY